jgi:site-specific DNA-methyltransferase (adenine-specific)
MPEPLLGRIITACSDPGETVLDPFGGSGTTLIVAKKLGRRFVGFELSKNYAHRIQARLDQTKLGQPLYTRNEKQKAPPTAMGKMRGANGKAVRHTVGSR